MDKEEQKQNHDKGLDKSKGSAPIPDLRKTSETKKQNNLVENNVIEKDMEVHIKPKENKEFKIKLFLYEFFIIFLAVSLSFFVENIREKYIDHHKEIQYINSLANDIKIDTLELSNIILRNKEQFKGIDTLLKKLEDPKPTKRTANYIYYYSSRYLNSLNVFIHTDRTMTQLKNAGGLRLIQNKAVSDSIVNYDGLVKDAEGMGDICLKFFYDLSNHQREMLDLKVLRTTEFNSMLTNPNLKLLNNDEKSINIYYNNALYYGYLLANYKEKLVIVKKHAIQLLETLKKEYGIE